jgi:hypothetical protein
MIRASVLECVQPSGAFLPPTNQCSNPKSESPEARKKSEIRNEFPDVLESVGETRLLQISAFGFL